jgi:ribosomal protein L14
MAKDQARRIESRDDVGEYLDYAVKHGVKKVTAGDEECVVEHVYGGVPNAIVKREVSEAIVKKLRSRIARLEELLAKFETPELFQ